MRRIENAERRRQEEELRASADEDQRKRSLIEKERLLDAERILMDGKKKAKYDELDKSRTAAAGRTAECFGVWCARSINYFI